MVIDVLYIVLGVASFILTLLFDVLSMEKVRGAKTGIWVLANGLLICSVLGLCFSPDKLPMPLWAIWFGWGLFSLSFSLLIYTFFINLPFRKTYVNHAESKLVTTGLYALVRHPGVILLGLTLISLILVSRSRLLLWAMPLWLLMDILVVIIEERFIFKQMFREYEAYQQMTPMLLPSKRSFMVFLKSLRRDQK